MGFCCWSYPKPKRLTSPFTLLSLPLHVALCPTSIIFSAYCHPPSASYRRRLLTATRHFLPQRLFSFAASALPLAHHNSAQPRPKHLHRPSSSRHFPYAGQPWAVVASKLATLSSFVTERHCRPSPTSSSPTSTTRSCNTDDARSNSDLTLRVCETLGSAATLIVTSVAFCYMVGSEPTRCIACYRNGKLIGVGFVARRMESALGKMSWFLLILGLIFLFDSCLRSLDF